MTYEQTQLLAMELDRSHLGALVQIITDSYSITGTLTQVDQHDNREWEIIYPERRLVPSGGEIFATVQIGPWRGQVIGNQPVTVERVIGTLEAPEREAIRESNLKAIQWEIDNPLTIKGDVVDPGPGVDKHLTDDELATLEASAREAFAREAYEGPGDGGYGDEPGYHFTGPWGDDELVIEPRVFRRFLDLPSETWDDPPND